MESMEPEHEIPTASITIRVARDKDIKSHVEDGDLYLDLVDFTRVEAFEVPPDTLICRFQDQVAQKFGIMVPTQLRVFYTRENKTSRPGEPVSSSISLLPLASLNSMSAGDIKLYLEEFSGDCAESAIREGKILVFLKLYDPEKSKLRYAGALYVDIKSRVSDIEPRLKDIACIDEQKEILLYEEIKMNPNVMCLPIATEQTFLFNEFKDGDIICYQENPNVPASCAYPYVPQFLQHMHDMKNVMRALKEENLTLKGCVDAYCLESETTRADCNRMEEILNWNSVFILEFRLSTLHDATDGFQCERLIQDNEYGRVYRGMIDGIDVAIKISSSKALFDHEVAIHYKYRRSSNTLKLLGRCSEAMSFVFSLPSKGCLQDYVVSDGSATSALKWYDRVRIAAEVCSALVSIHSCQPSLPHGDVRPCNIMLDSCFKAKLCNIGMGYELLKSGALPPDMRPYLDPDYLSSSEITPSSDVYSLGILVMCLLTGKPPVNIAATIRDALQKNSLDSVLDWSAGGWSNENALQLAELALRCVQTPKISRPDMMNVLAALEALNLEVQEDRIPEEFKCSISRVIMKDPHVAEDGYTYEKKDSITEWFATNLRSPLTNMPLESAKLVPNLFLRSMIQNYKERRGQH